MTPWNTLLTALRGVSANKLRSALTTLGVVIGVASVIAMLALGNGARAKVNASFRSLGADQVQIRQRSLLEDGAMVPSGQVLSYEDGLGIPANVDLVEMAAMSVSRVCKVRYGRRVIELGVTGTTSEVLLQLSADRQVQLAERRSEESSTAGTWVDQGRFFSQSEVIGGAKVCVLGFQTAENLFRGDDPVGQIVRVDRNRYLVVGVLAELKVVDPDQHRYATPNESLYVPISTAIRELYEEQPSVDIVAYVRDEGQMAEAKAEIASYLRVRHGVESNKEGEYEDDFVLTTRDDVLGAQQEAARTFALLLAAMATVSLIVGGIGIMNVMLVSVTERTREIGVRLAVGARQRDIVWQFTLEAVLISAMGGLLGVAVGILSVPLASTLSRSAALLAPRSIPLGCGIALLTGIVFGLYPAVRASCLEPIAALRHE